MNIHIIKEADGNGIVAVFGSTGGMSPTNLEQAVQKALDAAIESDELDMIPFMAAYLQENYRDAFLIRHADVEHHSHAFTVSEY